MTRLLVCSWAARGGGRAKALLSLTRYCDDSGIDVSVVTGAESWARSRLADHHGIDPVDDWREVDWRTTGKVSAVEQTVDDADPDAVLAFDTLLVKACRGLDRPVVGYLRTSTVPGVDEYWAPSRATTQEHTKELEGRGEAKCRPVYPTWYIETPDETPGHDERPIDVLIHGRKARGAVADLNPEYDIVLANRLTHDELQAMYRQTRLFLFPRPERFEPLGLMPLEAAAQGCRVAVPTNAGVAETLPGHAYEHPTDHVGDLLDAPEYDHPDVPTSPTDPVERINTLT